ncbi:MAG: hypothetical protein ACFFAK_11175, partial [Promethearchaeota archaeon]
MLYTFFMLNQFQVPSLPLWILAWIFLIIGLIALTILIVYTKYGREISIKLSVIAVIITAAFLGFATHFFLLNFG